jgi:PAS domain-containing protein
MSVTPEPRPSLKLIRGAVHSPPQTWSWFCGHCAAPPAEGRAPAPAARVCRACGLGLLLEAPSDLVPGTQDAFLVVDSALRVQAMSRRAETLLGVPEDLAVDRPVGDLLVPADAEAGAPGRFASAVAEAALSSDVRAHVFVRPWNTFGVRMRARVTPCGPPRAALLVLEMRRVANGQTLRNTAGN